MITKVNPLGHISLTNDYFSGLVSQAAKHCYGIAAMGENPTASTVRQTLRNGSLPEKGVSVSQQDGRLIIALHIRGWVRAQHCVHHPEHYPPRPGRSGARNRAQSGPH